MLLLVENLVKLTCFVIIAQKFKQFVMGSKITLLIPFVSVMFLATLTCTPPPIIQKCPDPVWKRYTSFKSYQVKDEIAKLETMLATADSEQPDSIVAADSSDTLNVNHWTALEIRQRLFELLIHHANPDYNIDKILAQASFLYQHGGPDSLRYRNWGRVVRDIKLLLQERDSLMAAFTIATENGKKDSVIAENLKREVKSFVKQCDSLNAVITTQQEMITKLQNLDVLMEQQRNKIQ
jgi:hypothetical protein